MKKSLLLIFLAAIVLAGCTSKLSKEQLFEKKQECASYKDSIEKGYKTTDENGIFCNLEELFYSKTLNTCLYAESCMSALDKDRNGNERLYIKDALTNKTIYSSSVIDINAKGLNYLNSIENERKIKTQELKSE